MVYPELKYFCDETFRVRSYEAGVDNTASLPTLCNYLQEAAGISADELGWGIRELQERGVTWMLSRLHLRIGKRTPWGTNVKVRTWPSGMKGRLLAKRCFMAEDDAGDEVLRAYSEWMYVDVRAQKILRLPDTFASLVPEGTPDVVLDDIGGKVAKLPEITSSVEIIVRGSDLDFNDHVNNVHYPEWMLESVPGGGLPVEADVFFRSAAKAGERLLSECFRDGRRTLHRVCRAADGEVLATAAMIWN